MPNTAVQKTLIYINTEAENIELIYLVQRAESSVLPCILVNPAVFSKNMVDK